MGPIKKTQDGYTWTRKAGVWKGDLHCRGVVEPREKLTAPAGHVYDAIIIGAGYTGLMAAREMSNRGMRRLETWQNNTLTTRQDYRYLC